MLTSVVVGGTAAPAQATILFCADSGTFPSVRCTVPYQAYPYGQTTGLRSSMAGYPDLGITASQEAGSDEIVTRLQVWDLNSDGYRARVWIDIFKGCLCVEPGYHVATTQAAEGGTQGATRVFDAKTNAGTVSEWKYVNAQTGASESYYTVRLRLGRFSLGSGQFQYGEEQRYYLYVYRI